MKDDKLLDLSSSSYKTSNNGFTATLSISNVKRDAHQGVYDCETNSSVYGVTRKSFSVTVIGLYLFKTSMTKFKTVLFVTAE